MREVVKYNNDMNSISFGGFKEKELDLFFSICFKLKEMGTNNVVLDFSELKELIGETSNPKRLKLHINNLNKKLAMINHEIEISPNVFERFVLFTNFTTNYNNNTLTIKTNDRFSYILNNLVNRYTKFDLIDFVNLRSIYSKNMFKLLKQWETTAEKVFDIEELRTLLGIPEKYRMSEIDKFILKPVMNELPNYFKNLKCEKIKEGRKIIRLKFRWKKQSEIIDIQEIEIKISEKLSKAIEKAKKNRFIEKLFTDENIEKLIDKFEEPVLIKGLNACYKDIQKDVKSLNYLIKAIETAAGKKTKKIVVEKEKEMDQEKLKPISKEKVLESEFAEIYKHYLMINDIEDNMFTKKAFAMNYEIVDKIILSDELKKIVAKYSIDNEQVLHFMGAGSSREEAIRVIESNIIYNNRIPEEHIKEYEEFLAWKKWNEERANKK